MAAESGRKGSQENLGTMYYEGKKGVQQDFTQAMKWFRRAADQNSKYSQFKIGDMYYKGEGAAQDFAEALKMYRKVAERNDDPGITTDAQLKIAEMYYKGEGVPKDFVQAYMWLAILLKDSRFDSKATTLSNALAAKMAPAQIAEAQRLAREWSDSHAS